MESKIRVFLFDTLDLPANTGLLKRNVFFVTERTGSHGKGPIARKLRLTHFIDAHDECLKTVYNGVHDEGCSDFIRNVNGVLLHFKKG